jgi:exoribonuclease-2
LPSLRPADLTLPSFTESDLVILRHIQASFFVSDRQFSPFSQTVPWILKRTDRYGEVFDAECTARFLVEIGVRSPWDNWAALGSTLEFVKGERRAEGRAQKSDDKEATSLPSEPAPTASASHPSLTPVLGPDDLYPTDQLDHLRHDFGQLNVFVIDDPDAAELDDGVSVERCADENRVWVHVHIADPTTLLHPGHRLAASALAKASTAYLPEGNYPLLPDSLTLDRFSLGGKGGVIDPVRGQEALSFSALVDLGTGEMVDYRVRAGIIRNVHVTSYQAVNTALGCQPAEACWPIGRPPARFEATKPRPFKPEWMTDITLLQQVAKAIHRRRFQAGAISWSSAEYQVKVSPSPLPTLPFQPTSRAVFSDGAPFVAYRVTPAGGSRSESQQLVASCMTLAGNVAGRFFRDRGLPTAYRHSPAAISKTREGLERLLASRDPESGHVDPLELDRLGVVLQAGKVSLRPETHWAMGITAAEGGYVRVTSPLRRYGDIIAHWQIKHALLAEASSASSGPASGARTPRSSALFSASEVLDWGTSVELTSRLVKEASDRSRAFWAVYALERHARKQSTLDAHGSSYPPVHAYPFTRAPMLPTARLGPFTTAIVVKSNVDPLSPLARTIVVAVPDLGLELEAHYPKGKTYALGDRVNVLVDEFYLGAQSRMVGTVIGGGEEA